MAAKKKATKKKATKSKAKKAAAAPAMESVIVGSKVKAAIKALGCNTAGGALDNLNGVVYWYVAQACARAAANKRKTVQGHDFDIPDAGM